MKTLRWVVFLAVVGWVAVAVPRGLAAESPKGDSARGEAIYLRNCAMCHGRDATGMMGMHPALRGVVDRLTREGVEVTVRNGRATNPPMPAFGARLRDRDIADVIAYLETLPPGPRNFGPELGDGGRSGGMGGMPRMDDMMGGASTWLWVVIIVLAAALAGLVGYLVGRRRSG